MAQVFGLKYGLPRELLFIGSILEDSDGIGIVNMPRKVRTEGERLMKQGKVMGMDRMQKQKRLGAIRFGRPPAHSGRKRTGKQKALFSKPEKSKKLFFVPEFNPQQSRLKEVIAYGRIT